MIIFPEVKDFHTSSSLTTQSEISIPKGKGLLIVIKEK
jgi:hypothetical protein